MPADRSATLRGRVGVSECWSLRYTHFEGTEGEDLSRDLQGSSHAHRREQSFASNAL